MPQIPISTKLFHSNLALSEQLSCWAAAVNHRPTAVSHACGCDSGTASMSLDGWCSAACATATEASLCSSWEPSCLPHLLCCRFLIWAVLLIPPEVILQAQVAFIPLLHVGDTEGYLFPTLSLPFKRECAHKAGVHVCLLSAS